MDSLFSLFILSLGEAAHMALGTLPQTATDGFTVDIENAKYNIDLLSMLQEKTRNNLDQTEQRILEQTLYDLRLKYLEKNKTQEKT